MPQIAHRPCRHLSLVLSYLILCRCQRTLPPIASASAGSDTDAGVEKRRSCRLIHATVERERSQGTARWRPERHQPLGSRAALDEATRITLVYPEKNIVLFPAARRGKLHFPIRAGPNSHTDGAPVRLTLREESALRSVMQPSAACFQS